MIEIFEPVSERGKAGIDELQKQAVALLSFKPLPKAVFDAQVSFNMLSQYGSDAPLSLEEIELKIDRHLASLLAASRRAHALLATYSSAGVPWLQHLRLGRI